MVKKIILSFFILSFSFLGTLFAADFDAISPKDFKDKIKEKNTVLIDIRTVQETALGKIKKDALEIDYYGKNFRDELNKLDKNKTYLIYCRTGHRTDESKKIMKELGFKSVYDLKGGIAVWPDKLEDEPDKTAVLEKYKGKPTLILIAGTFCSHCQKDIPEIEEKVFDRIGEQANLIINVADGQDGNRFETKIKQVSEPALDYKVITGEECKYVPSWVILDKDSKIINSKCGDSGQDEIITTLKKLGVKFEQKINSQNKIESKYKSDKKENNLIIFYILIVFGVLGGTYWVFRK